MAAGRSSAPNSVRLQGLKRTWINLAAANLGLLAAGGLVLRQLVGPVSALQWILQALMVTAYFHYLLWTGLGDNHPPQSAELLPGLGPGTLLTLLRGVLISFLAGFVFFAPLLSPRPPVWLIWAPGILYFLAVWADFGDGYLARRSDHVTCLGEALDTQTDALGLLVASLVAIGLGRLPLVYLAVGLAYYVFRLGIAFRRRRGKTVHPLSFRPTARLAAGFQMGFVVAALLPVFSPRVLAPAAWVFMLPSLLGFAWDWMKVSDRFDRREKALQIAARWLKLILPLLLRAILLPILIPLFWHLLRMESSSRDFLLCLLLALLVIGWMGRTAALLVSLMLAQQLSFQVPGTGFQVAFISAVALMLNGTGAFSIWKPEDRWLTHKAGHVRAPQRPSRGIGQ